VDGPEVAEGAGIDVLVPAGPRVTEGAGIDVLVPAGPGVGVDVPAGEQADTSKMTKTRIDPIFFDI